MILLLPNDLAAQMLRLLGESDEGSEIVRVLTEPPALPPDRELVRMARAGEDAPAAVVRAVERRARGVEALATTREELAELVRHVHEAGVPPSALIRWTGLKRSRIYEMIGREAA